MDSMVLLSRVAHGDGRTEPESKADEENDDDDAALDAQIAEEERRIRVYEAQVALLQRRHPQQQQEQKTTAAAAAIDKEDHENEILAQFLLDETSAVSTNNSAIPSSHDGSLLTEEDVQFDELQARLRNFLFTRVESQQQQQQQDRSYDSYGYTLHGYFLANPSMHAIIQLTVAELNDSSRKLTLADVQCSLRVVLEPHEEEEEEEQPSASWLQEQAAMAVKGSHRTHYLAQWLSVVDEFLTWDRHRRQFLAQFQNNGKLSQCRCPRQVFVQHGPGQSHLKIAVYSIPPVTSSSSETIPTSTTTTPRKPNTMLSILWTWRWNERRDRLRLSSSAAAVAADNEHYHHNTNNNNSRLLRQPDLDQLVRACGDNAGRAIQLLVTHCSGCQCWRKTLQQSHEQSTDPNPKEDTTSSSSLVEAVFDADDEGDNAIHDSSEDSYRSEASNNKPTESRQRNNHSSPISNHNPPASPFRYSPVTGRRRSDYEVERFQRIQRNERKLQSLGLMGGLRSASSSSSSSRSITRAAAAAARTNQSKDDHTTGKQPQQLQPHLLTKSATATAIHPPLLPSLWTADPKKPPTKTQPHTTKESRSRMRKSPPSSSRLSTLKEDCQTMQNLHGSLWQEGSNSNAVRQSPRQPQNGTTTATLLPNDSESSNTVTAATNISSSAKAKLKSAIRSSTKAEQSVVAKAGSAVKTASRKRFNSNTVTVAHKKDSGMSTRSSLPARTNTTPPTEHFRPPARSTHGMVVRDDTSLIRVPKSPPSRMTDGTFGKPRGRPPSQYEWDNLRGLWVKEGSVPIASEDAVQNSATFTSGSASFVSASRAKITKSASPLRLSTLSQRMESSIVPTSPPFQRVDGKFVRPLKSPSKHYHWDEDQGLWSLTELSGAVVRPLDGRVQSARGQEISPQARASTTTVPLARATIHVDNTRPGSPLLQKDNDALQGPLNCSPAKSVSTRNSPTRSRLSAGHVGNRFHGVMSAPPRSLSLEKEPANHKGVDTNETVRPKQSRKRQYVGGDDVSVLELFTASPTGNPDSDNVGLRRDDEGKRRRCSNVPLSGSRRDDFTSNRPPAGSVEQSRLRNDYVTSPQGQTKLKQHRNYSRHLDSSSKGIPTRAADTKESAKSYNRNVDNMSPALSVLCDAPEPSTLRRPAAKSPHSAVAVKRPTERGNLLKTETLFSSSPTGRHKNINNELISVPAQHRRFTKPIKQSTSGRTLGGDNGSAFHDHLPPSYMSLIDSENGTKMNSGVARTATRRSPRRNRLVPAPKYHSRTSTSEWDGFGGFLLPKKPPSLLNNGNFQRPIGRPPVDHVWDDSRGVWIPTTDDFPSLAES